MKENIKIIERDFPESCQKGLLLWKSGIVSLNSHEWLRDICFRGSAAKILRRCNRSTKIARITSKTLVRYKRISCVILVPATPRVSDNFVEAIIIITCTYLQGSCRCFCHIMQSMLSFPSVFTF